MPNIYQECCTVIPLHMLRQMAENGDDEAREKIADTLLYTARIAEDRSQPLIEAAAVTAKGRILVYDAHHKRSLPGKLVMDDRHTGSTDIEAHEAFDGCTATYDFYYKVFRRKSIDGKGLPLLSTIHYGVNFNNAMWNSRQMVYGDGDGKLFNRFTIAPDVTAHEITHGLTQYTAALEYHDEPGALNEHISDAFGIMVKQWMLRQAASLSDWLIGAGILGPNVHGIAIRSMKKPGSAYDDKVLGRDPQPAHMRNYVTSADDNGGVHINSGIPNHAFYLFATDLGGYAWDVAGRIWFIVLTTRLFPHAGFQDFAVATIIVAGEEYGVGGTVQTKLAEAWSQVGVTVPPSLTRQKQLPPSRVKWRDRQKLRKAA